jgi:hypothetical protein
MKLMVMNQCDTALSHEFSWFSIMLSRKWLTKAKMDFSEKNCEKYETYNVKS